jgi:glycosyltransferase involved in cell wall biosynthesis
MADSPEQDQAWMIFRPGGAPRWGSEARRQSLFEVLAERTGARSIRYWTQLDRRGTTIPLRWLRRPASAPRPLLAASEQPPIRARDLIAGWSKPFAVAIYDDPVAQSAAFGLELEAGATAPLRERLATSIELFDWLVVPTGSFADLIGLPAGRVIVAGNGTDTRRIVPGPWPDRPVVGLVSGAASGRGIESLVEAAIRLRASRADLLLRLWLVATSPASEAYLAALRTQLAAMPWVEIATVPHDDLGAALASATVLCIPHPANAYMDVALPVKLLDSLAAGRPVVVTPRTEIAEIVARHGAGIIAAGDGPDDLAAAIQPLLADPARARGLGEAARLAAEREFDWRVVGGRLADTLLERAGRAGVPRTAAGPGIPPGPGA